jgi:phenylacetate-CoA ligase
MLIIKGINVYPSQLEAALLTVADPAPHYQLVVDRREAFNPEITVVAPKAIPRSEGEAVRVVERR